MLSATTEEAKSNYVECYFQRHSFLLSKKDQFVDDKWPLVLGTRIFCESSFLPLNARFSPHSRKLLVLRLEIL